MAVVDQLITDRYALYNGETLFTTGYGGKCHCRECQRMACKSYQDRKAGK